MGKFSPDSKVGIFVLADENMREYTAINIQSSGKMIFMVFNPLVIIGGKG